MVAHSMVWAIHEWPHVSVLRLAHSCMLLPCSLLSSELTRKGIKDKMLDL